MTPRLLTIDGNEAAARVAYKTNEICAIYPITPASPMGELCDAWAAAGRTNLWDDVPKIVEMQSEAGAAGAIHGALQTGALATTFTASQGLLLMLPNMYKIAGELTPTVFHVAARAVATHALSIFGDHSDVMAARATGFAMLASGSVQEAQDLALIAQSASLESRVPFLHFFDGFRTSHETMKIAALDDDEMRAMIDAAHLRAHRERSLSPERPVLRGSAQNPDVFFQSREAANPFYAACPEIVEGAMRRFAALTGRSYRLFDYAGAADAEHVVVVMGSGAETAHECVDHLVGSGQKVGVLKVHLYRPFVAAAFAAALPPTVRVLAVLDRTKEPGACGEPLYLDVVTAVSEMFDRDDAPLARRPRVIGGRYGLASKEFTPAMVRAVFAEMSKPKPKNHFTVGICDDLSHTSLEVDNEFTTEKPDTVRALFYGLGSDGTVGANKNSIKIIGEATANHVQGYFVYDSKKAGSVTVSHLRFGPLPIRSSYLIREAHFVACHHPSFLDKQDILAAAMAGGIVLVNTPAAPERFWDTLPREAQQHILDKKLRVWVIDAFKAAADAGTAGRINTIMQTCFFAISGVLPLEQATAHIKQSIAETYGKKGSAIVDVNVAAVERALDHLHEIPIPARLTATRTLTAPVPDSAPEFVRRVTGPLLAGAGETLPVSALPCDGTYPTGTARWEKRAIAAEIPIWEPELCVQCGKCALVCPHTAIRSKIVFPAALVDAPRGFRPQPVRGKDFEGLGKEAHYVIQVAPDDCTGCGICVDVCPARSKERVRDQAINMRPYAEHAEAERVYFDYFLELPEVSRPQVKTSSVRGSQLLEPLFEFSGACAGCGETPYVKLVSQLFGDRAIIANATGCSSIYGGNLPTTPWSRNRDGRGPAWSNSLFEDNAEFGLGMRITLDQQIEAAHRLLDGLRPQLGSELVDSVRLAKQDDEAGIYEQRQRVAMLKPKLAALGNPAAERLLAMADVLVKRSVWILGGDGWAYDIGFGGLDHVFASGRNVNILVLDTEVYSNTGGQMSKSTPRAAVAKFAAAGKELPKKDLALLAMSYGHVYVANVAMGANDAQTVRAFLEAEAFEGPSLILAYSHCIAHGIQMRTAMRVHKLAVQSGHWPLFRFHPGRHDGAAPLHLDSRAPSVSFEEYAYSQARFKMLRNALPQRARELLQLAQQDASARWRLYDQLARHSGSQAGNGGTPAVLSTTSPPAQSAAPQTPSPEAAL